MATRDTGPSSAGARTWLFRDVELDDLEDVVRLDDLSSTTDEAPIFPLADVVAAVSQRHPAVAATSDGVLVGVAVSTVAANEAWIIRLALAPDHRHQGLGSRLVGQLEQRLVAQGVERIRGALPSGETGATAFRNCGFEERREVVLYEKREFASPGAVELLRELGGVVLPAGLWDRVAGMVEEKALIERRLVLPLARPEEAAAHGVTPPRAAVLFGPPGTGKTTFARAVASRLGWPFVELFPSRLAAGPGGLPAGLSEAFADIGQLSNVVVFIDEVEEIASERTPGGPSVAVVNELLKALVTFRETPGRLMICATNAIGTLDPAFLRHGRFDYVVPIGPPDEGARRAMWAGHLRAAGEEVDLESLVEASAMLTPADTTHAAQVVAQRMFERAVDLGRSEPAVTGDYVQAIHGVRPTLDAAVVTAFEGEIREFARS